MFGLLTLLEGECLYVGEVIDILVAFGELDRSSSLRAEVSPSLLASALSLVSLAGSFIEAWH
jgi:hypothetical protein